MKSRKLRKFTFKSQSRRARQARKYVNSDEKRTCKHETTKIATKSVRHLDLGTRPFTFTLRTPSVKHTVWGTKPVCQLNGAAVLVSGACDWQHPISSTNSYSCNSYQCLLLPKLSSYVCLYSNSHSNKKSTTLLIDISWSFIETARFEGPVTLKSQDTDLQFRSFHRTSSFT